MNDIYSDLEVLRIDVDTECQYCDPTGNLKKLYEGANEMLDECIDRVKRYYNKKLLEKFRDYQTDWLTDHNDIVLEKEVEELMVNFFKYTTNCFIRELNYEEEEFKVS